MKRCCRCRELKSLDQFQKSKGKRDGVLSYCKACKAYYNKRYRDRRNRDPLVIARRDKRMKEIEDGYARASVKAEMRRLIRKIRVIHRRYYMKTHKLCRGCGQWLTHNAFTSDADNGGMSHRCSLCTRSVYIKRRGRSKGVMETITNMDIWSIYRTFNHQCYKCKTDINLTIDHHEPSSPLSFSNAVILCKSCNASKSNKPASVFYTADELKDLYKLLTP